jgi:hypothetical protein
LFPIEQTIEGLDLALMQMKEGEVAKVIIGPKYGFGEHGNQHGFHGSGKPIPGNATLEFQVELLDWKLSKREVVIYWNSQRSPPERNSSSSSSSSTSILSLYLYTYGESV